MLVEALPVSPIFEPQPPNPRGTIGLYAQSYCRVLRGGDFLSARCPCTAGRLAASDSRVLMEALSVENQKPETLNLSPPGALFIIEMILVDRPCAMGV